MKTIFEHIKKSYSAGKFRGVGMVLAIGAFFLFFTGVGLAQPLPPHPRGLPYPPGPHHLPGPPVIVPHHPGPPPHPGWFWVPGYHHGHRWVPGHWSRPRGHRGRR
jgi:hypothetical protein